MGANADKPHLWKQDIAASVDMYNAWFMNSAPDAYRSRRIQTAEEVRQAMELTHDLRNIEVDLLTS